MAPLFFPGAAIELGLVPLALPDLVLLPPGVTVPVVVGTPQVKVGTVPPTLGRLTALPRASGRLS